MNFLKRKFLVVWGSMKTKILNKKLVKMLPY